MIATGLDRLLDRANELTGRKFGLLAHSASVTRDLVPAHLALIAAGASPVRLFGAEHGYYGVEQDMVPAGDAADPWTGLPIVSLYGDSEASLRPRRDALVGLDLLVIDLQDIGARYYTFAATAVWAAEAALACGVEVWLLDRPNPLGGVVVEGNLRGDGFDSFVGAFRLPVRHGLTLGEIFRLEAQRHGWSDGWRIFELEGWSRQMLWPELERPWVAPSPNVPDFATALLYPGLCLLEATEFSEGRGTTRPFRLLGAPGLEPTQVARALAPLVRYGVRAVPTYFRPWHQKHRGEVCGGVELLVLDPSRVEGFRVGVEILAALRAVSPDLFRWRTTPYEFVAERPAIDLLAGCSELGAAIDGGGGLEEWVASWHDDERRFIEERCPALLYAEES